MAVLQDIGRIALAQAVAAQTIHIAWGRGLPAWDAVPEPEPSNATALVDEVGRRLVTDIAFVTPDAAGEIEMPNGDRYAPSATPTPWLYLRCTFGFTDAQGETLREMGVFFGTTNEAHVPIGQRYLLPADIAEPGKLYTLERRAAYPRSGSVRQVEEIVLPF
jgi:hypothetical protein